MSDEFDCAKLLIVRNKFLCCVPVGEIGLKEYLKGISWNAQALLLDSTVNGVLLQEYPVRLSYQKAFLKLLIEVLEENCAEVHDILYDTYCVLLNTVDAAKYSYKHYCIEEKIITLKENKNFVSEGTTGLCSWQAGLALSEYCLTNSDRLERRTILELGAGVGLVGITVALHCQPRAIYLTDCHPKVLTVLAENVALNLTAARPHTTAETISAATGNSIDSHTVKRIDSARWFDSSTRHREPLNCPTVKETSSARFDSISTEDSAPFESVNRCTVKRTVSARFDSIPVGNSAVSSHTITETLSRCRGCDSSAPRESLNCHTVKNTVQREVKPVRSSNTSAGISDKCVDTVDDTTFDQKFDSSVPRESLNCHTVKDTVQLARSSNTSAGISDKCVDTVDDTTFDQKFDSSVPREPVNCHTVKDTVQLARSSNTSAGISDKCVDTVDDTKFDQKFDSSVPRVPLNCHTVKETIQREVQRVRSSNTSAGISDKCDDTTFDRKFDSILVHTVQDTDTRVCVFNLPWESVEEIECCSRIVPDLILAADVVYDSSVFQSLCETVKYFLNSNAQCEVIFACTERNSITLNEFINVLETNHFNIRELSPPESKYFYWSTEIPIRFFLVTVL